MDKILVHCFTNDHMQRMFFIFRLISWEVSVALAYSLRKDWKRANEKFCFLFLCVFCKRLEQVPTPKWQMEWHHEHNVECRRTRSFEERSQQLRRTYLKIFVLSTRKASRRRLNSLTGWRWENECSDGALFEAEAVSLTQAKKEEESCYHIYITIPTIKVEQRGC